LDLFEAGVEMMRQNLRRQFPEADEKEIASRLAQWLQERPGAEFGDCDGRPVPWPRSSHKKLEDLERQPPRDFA
jgi:hypothetical protein